MRARRIIPFLAAPALLLGLSGCGYVHLGTTPKAVTTIIADDKLMKENADLRWNIDNEAQLLMARMGEAIVRTWRRSGAR